METKFLRTKVLDALDRKLKIKKAIEVELSKKHHDNSTILDFEKDLIEVNAQIRLIKSLLS